MKGQSLIAVILVLAITCYHNCDRSRDGDSCCPQTYREGSLALGVSYIGTIFKVIVPAAKSGIMTAIVLGLGRAIGETMAVILLGMFNRPTSLTDSVRHLRQMLIEMGYVLVSKKCYLQRELFYSHSY